MFFPPEMGAPAGRFYDFARNWIEAGHRVTVVTGFPNFPGGVIHEGYRGKFYQVEHIDGIEVRRCFLWTSGRFLLGRALAYASFVLSSSLCVLFGRLDYDCVVATSPPPTAGLPGLVAAWRRGVPLVFDIRDIWPESVVQSGRLKNPLVIRAFEWTARFLYRQAAVVTTVTQGWKRRLEEIGVPAPKVRVLPNGVDMARFEAEAELPIGAISPELDEKARWFTYAGILNTPQGLDVILEAAARMRRESPANYQRSQFLLVGEGPREADLVGLRDRLGLERVLFIPRQSRAVIYALLRRSYAILVTLRPRKDTSTVPSKIYESMASGRPLIYSAAGEGADAVRAAAAGVVCPPGDAEALCAAMCAYLDAPQLAAEHGRAGQRFVARDYDRRQIAADFLAAMNSAVG